MDRRDFLKMAGAGATVLAMPEALRAALSGMSDPEIEKRVQDLVAQMTLDEKIEQMAGSVPEGQLGHDIIDAFKPRTWNTPENKRLGVPSIRCIDGPRGIGMGKPTCFPVSMARGATWDPELEQRIGEVIGYEGRALGANAVMSPCINLLRHPRWGRAQETYGEDPVHLGLMGAANVVGLQKHVIGCPKHFAGNSIEDTRYFVNVRMDERTLREMYLPHFKKCVDAGAASIMSAYSDLNGYLCAQNKHLLRDVLKGEWGFDGFVISDWGRAVEDAVAAANAGLDLEMPIGVHFGPKLKKAVQAGQVSEQTIDEAVTRLLRAKLRYIKSGDHSLVYDRKKVGGREHADLALETARKGIVLLQNQDGALPLDRHKIKTIAVVGRLADMKNTGDWGSSMVSPPYVVTALEGIRNKAGPIVVEHDLGHSPTSAAALAAKADATVVVVGLTFKDEGEGGTTKVTLSGDREYLHLHPRDVDLITAVAAKSKRCIVVLEGGAAITMEGWADRVPAILMAWYPGMEGGNAIAEVLFGDVNPSGKLPIVFPRAESDLPPFENRSPEVQYDLWHGYRYQDKKGLTPLFPFGFGLSYTTYKYDNLRLSDKRVRPDGRLEVKVDVTNTGPRSGEEIVQLYVGYNGSRVERSLKDLKAFGKLALAPGETRTLSLELKAPDLAYWDLGKNAWDIEPIEYVVYLGPSSRQEDLRLSDTFRIS